MRSAAYIAPTRPNPRSFIARLLIGLKSDRINSIAAFRSIRFGKSLLFAIIGVDMRVLRRRNS